MSYEVWLGERKAFVTNRSSDAFRFVQEMRDEEGYKGRAMIFEVGRTVDGDIENVLYDETIW